MSDAPLLTGDVLAPERAAAALARDPITSLCPDSSTNFLLFCGHDWGLTHGSPLPIPAWRRIATAPSNNGPGLQTPAPPHPPSVNRIRVAQNRTGEAEANMRWIGSTPEPVAIGNQSFELSWCSVGRCDCDLENPTIIDPQLAIAPQGERCPADRRRLVSYAELSPAERRAYLEWISGGREAPAPPRSFGLMFLSSLEHAIVRDRLMVALGEVRAKLVRLLTIYAEDLVFSAAARRLLTLCEFIDPEFVPAPLFATAETNFRGEMPFDVRHFLGWMLKSAGRLEADAGLLFYLQQPGRRLEPLEAQYFRELHASWSLRYAEAAEGAFRGADALPRLALRYEPLVGGFERTFESVLPDVAALPPAAALEVLFRECSAPLWQLRHEPVGRVLSNLLLPAGGPQSAAGLNLNRKVGAGADLAALVPDSKPQVIRVAQLLAILLEAPEMSPTSLVPRVVANQVTRILDEEGFGFEPDTRSGLPPSLRPDRSITLFRSGSCHNRKPSEPFLLAQAAVVLSGVAQHWSAPLEPLTLDRIEERLPFRHRFSDDEYRRLQATQIAIASLEEAPRKFVDRWVKRLARTRRIDHLVTGFGIAFRGQRRNSHLAKLARAVIIECQSLIRVDELLTAATEAAIPDECYHRSLESRVEALQARPLVVSQAPPTACPAQADGAADAFAAVPDLSPPFDGLEARHSELLLALHDRPRTHAELTELARSRRLTLAGAVARINEWALLTFGAGAIDDDEEFAISPAARAFLDQRLVQK